MDLRQMGIPFEKKYIQFSEEDILKIIEKTNLKLHPSYKLAKTTFDYPSYYKMRSAFIANPEYRKKVLSTYPMLCLDQYRYERLLNG